MPRMKVLNSIFREGLAEVLITHPKILEASPERIQSTYQALVKFTREHERSIEILSFSCRMEREIFRR